MYQLSFLLGFFYTVQCASYQRYESSSQYPGYSTTPNYQNQQQIYKSGTYGNDIAQFPGRYPSSNMGYSGSNVGYSSSNVGYPNTNNGYSSNNYYSSGLDSYNQPGYSTPGYGDTYGKGYSTYEMPFMNDIRGYCVNRSPQTGIWVESLMGMWYGVEYIQHLGGDAFVDYARTCIVIHLSEPKDLPSTENQLYHVQHINAKFRHEYRYLRLLWDEAGHNLEFSLYFRNDSAGYWQVFDGQNGTIAGRSSYQQFSGTVQVLKAVNDHLVLNFCQEGVNGRTAQLYSVLFSRDPGYIPSWELDSVHSMLQNKKLSVASRRMVCGNGAVKLNGIVVSILTCLLAYIVGSK